MRTLSKFASTAALALATTLALSCSSDDGGDNNSSGGSPSGGGSFTDKGNDISKYKTITIGTQTWMAENLDYNVADSRCYNEGDEVIVGSEPICYGEDRQVVNCEDYEWIDIEIVRKTKTFSTAEVQANCNKYGRLYRWATAMTLPDSCNFKLCTEQIQEKHRGICPQGWHIPHEDEIIALREFIESQKSCTDCTGKHLKSKNGWYDNGNGLDSYEFTALPSGIGYYYNEEDDSYSQYTYLDSLGSWWSTTEKISTRDEATTLRLTYSSDRIRHDELYKYTMLSVRCMKD